MFAELEVHSPPAISMLSMASTVVQLQASSRLLKLVASI